MFLPDGRVLIMDSELFKQTIERSIVLDLFEGTSLTHNSFTSEESKKDEEKSSIRQGKEKKPSQAN
jgi:hypothetical protein